jgi:hypothetical protein
VPDTQPQVLEHAQTVRIAAEKAASLTKQLLAFGRGQVLVLQVMDLNEILAELKEMLSTLSTEHIQLMMMPSSRPLPVRVTILLVCLFWLVSNATGLEPAKSHAFTLPSRAASK